MAYTTTADVKAYLGISGGGDDDLIEVLIDAAQAYIDAETGRTFEASSNTSKYFDCAAPFVDGRTLYFGEWEAASIDSVTNGDGDTIDSSYYVTLPRNTTPYYGIKLLGSSGLSWTYIDDPESAIEVSAKWAYSASPPDDIVHATKELAAYLYRQKDAQVFDTTAFPEAGVIQVPKGVPMTVRLIISRYRKKF